MGTVPHDGDIIGDGEDLLHLVGDIDDAAAALPQGADDAKEVSHLLLGQRRGRFIQHNDLGVVGDRLGDLCHLPLRHRHFAHHAARVNGKP